MRLAGLVVAVRDVPEAVGFYRDVLGFDDCGDGGAVGPPSGVRIVFEAVGAASVIGGLMADGLLGRLVFAVGDCDAVFGRAEASGAEVMQEPITRAGGVRDCVVRDPSGNMLRFVQGEGVGGCSR